MGTTQYVDWSAKHAYLLSNVEKSRNYSIRELSSALTLLLDESADNYRERAIEQLTALLQDLRATDWR